MDIFSFGLNVPVPAEAQNPETLGGKGYGLVWMDSLGVNVPPGFILPCSLMQEYGAKPATFMKKVAKEIKPWLQRMEDKFGYMPLVSVRSGARQSMPGMMDTILNVGIDKATVQDWHGRLGAACIENSDKRLTEMYGAVVKGIDKAEFAACTTPGESLAKYKELTGEDFPDATGQLLGAIEAVFKSWNNERAVFYRKMNNIPSEWGTAVVVQAMVFGNLNDQSGTGVLFTRNPDTGANEITGEFLVNAQGEDVVDGSHTPMPLSKMKDWNPAVSSQLRDTVTKLETARKDVQDVEFTIQDSQLFILQTRNAKRSPGAAVRIALDMRGEGLISSREFLDRVKPVDFDKAQAVVLDPTFDKKQFANGISACSGVVTGIVVKSSQAAIDCKEPCILVTEETTPDDIQGMYASVGIITMNGGSTCHAAVVARSMNKPCIVGIGMSLDKFKDGTKISIDGATGRVWKGTVPVIDGSKSKVAVEYTDVLRTIWGYVPVVYGPVEGHFKELAYCPSDVPDSAAASLETIHSLLHSCDRLYLDFRPSRLDDSEKVFSRLFSTNENDVANTIALTMLQWSEDARKKVVLIGYQVTGIATMRQIASLQDMVLAEGTALIGSVPEHEVEAVKKVIAWQQKDGFQFASYGEYVKDTKNFITDQQAMQLRDPG